MKIAIYARVSKEDGPDGTVFQNPENQLAPMREFCKTRGWAFVEFVEKASGGSDRPVFQEVLGRARQLEFKGILVWSLDRFSREGILNTLTYIQRLRERGVWVKSIKEEWLDTDAPFADLMLAQFAWFAAFEKKRISDRTKAALAQRRALGVRLGRPKRCLSCGWSHKPGKACKVAK